MKNPPSTHLGSSCSTALTSLEIAELKETFPSITEEQLSTIAEIVYNDGWCSYEESDQLLIFKDVRGQYFKASTGYCVMSGEYSGFEPVLLSEKEALDEIKEMDRYLKHAS